jgi:hypothetical protein
LWLVDTWGVNHKLQEAIFGEQKQPSSRWFAAWFCAGIAFGLGFGISCSAVVGISILIEKLL